VPSRSITFALWTLKLRAQILACRRVSGASPALHLFPAIVATPFSAHPARFDRLAVSAMAALGWGSLWRRTTRATACAQGAACILSQLPSPGAKSGSSSGRPSSTGGSRGAKAARRNHRQRCRRWRSRPHEYYCASWDARWRAGRAEGVRRMTIRYRKGRCGMLFSCSVGYRASTSEPLFRRFLDGVLGSSPRRFQNAGFFMSLL
jgi:hypothetical protein